jgi:hypothetical protein
MPGIKFCGDGDQKNTQSYQLVPKKLTDNCQFSGAVLGAVTEYKAKMELVSW